MICLVLMGMILYRLYGWSYLSLKEIMQGFNAGGDVRCDENEIGPVQEKEELPEVLGYEDRELWRRK